jgi:hypothetical protein
MRGNMFLNYNPGISAVHCRLYYNSKWWHIEWILPHSPIESHWLKENDVVFTATSIHDLV